MKNSFLYLALSFAVLTFTSCKKEVNNDVEYNIDQSYSLTNIAYGSHGKQKMDIYLPEGRSAATTKVFVLIHGGGWHAGSKSDMTASFDNLKEVYPDYAIINMNYRLGTVQSPGYDKQIKDIQKALEHFQDPKYNVSDEYFLIGASAGAHLSLLYGYGFDNQNNVKGICNIVGPSDITDPAYLNGNDPYLEYAFTTLVGPYTYQQKPELYEEASPITYISATSPPTISFYGDTDPLIPTSQMTLLHDKLNLHGVDNEATMYAGEGHGNWSYANNLDFILKLYDFINTHF